jgi:sugar phosphate isomerase/epimerase
LKLLLSSVVFDGPLREGEMTQADLITVAGDYQLDGLELRDTYWQGGEIEIDATVSRLWAEEFAVVYATGDVLAAKDMESTLAGLGKMVENIYLAAKIGAKILRINTGMVNENIAFMHADSYREMMARVEQESKELGITLALENPPQLGGGSIMTLNWIFTQFPFLHMTYDTANWLPAGENAVTALDKFSKNIGYVHLKDVYKEDQVWQFCGPGQGQVPFKEILDALARAKYEGYYAFEFNGGPNPRANLEKAIRFIRGQGPGAGG